MDSINLSLPADEKTALQRIARRENVSVSVLLRAFIRLNVLWDENLSDARRDFWKLVAEEQDAAERAMKTGGER